MKKVIILSLLFCISILGIILLVIFTIQQVHRHDELQEEVSEFETYKKDFETINDYIDTFSLDEDEISFLVNTTENGEFASLWNEGDIPLNDELKQAFDSIFGAFHHYDFSFITKTEKEISYFGLGYRKFVYSYRDKKPTFFYSPGDCVRFDTYKLAPHWYLQTTNYR